MGSCTYDKSHLLSPSIAFFPFGYIYIFFFIFTNRETEIEITARYDSIPMVDKICFLAAMRF